MGLREWIIPQDRIFFDLFDRQAAIVTRAAEALVNLVERYQELPDRAREMEGLEHEGDRITHEIYELLNTTFITPLDHQEISRLASALDDVLDFIDGSTQKMLTFDLTETDIHMRELAKLIELSVTELQEAVRQIRTLKDPRAIESRCIEVNRLENLADDVLAHAIRDLFQSGDPVAIIKLKDIYETLEVATDKCEDAANVLSDIAIRHG